VLDEDRKMLIIMENKQRGEFANRRKWEKSAKS